LAAERFFGEMRWSWAKSGAGHHLLRELWAYRELVYAFAVRDLQVRYRQTIVGIAWVIIQPLGNTLLYSGLINLLRTRTATEDVSNFLLILSGAIVWQPFAQGVQQTTLCLANNRTLITKTYFPRLLLPISAVTTPLIDFAIGWACLFVFSLLFGVTIRFGWWIAPLLAVFITLMSLAVGMWTSMLNALYRDLMSLVPFALQIGLLMSPVVWDTHVLIPDRWWTIAAMNPMVTIIGLFRTLWFGQPAPTLTMIAISAVSLTMIFWSGLWFFRRNEDLVADSV
jgi:lipopolysaccharide transport system permease protein